MRSLVPAGSGEAGAEQDRMSTSLLSHSGPVRWGILGPGAIAHKLAQSVQARGDDNVLVAVGSRDLGRASEFAAKYGIPNAHGSYEALVNDPDVDVVYVCTPHPMHKEHCLLAIAAGKHVLCEKPFTINRGEAEAVVAAARAKGVFLMEAMWSRFFPLMAELRRRIAEGVIGDVRMVQADFGFRAGYNPEGRLFKPELGGGALLDVGVYAVHFASWFLGTPDRTSGLATLCGTGVDEQAAFVLGHPSGALAVLSTAVRTNTHYEADILGTDGRIRVHASWYHPVRATIFANGAEPVELEFEEPPVGFVYQVDEVTRCLRAGRTESEVLPLDESLDIMGTMDALRAPWGVRYPTE